MRRGKKRRGKMNKGKKRMGTKREVKRESGGKVNGPFASLKPSYTTTQPHNNPHPLSASPMPDGLSLLPS